MLYGGAYYHGVTLTETPTMFRTMMTRDKTEAERAADSFRSRIGEVDRWGRITDTLIGVEVREVELSGRPLYQVVPVVLNRDPFFDA
jgi:hypothetical protein